MTVELAIAAALGWILAVLMVGLYLGERGRRKDAQRREGKIRVDPPRPPKVAPPSDSSAATHDQRVALAEAKEKWVEQAVQEGYSPEEAEEDWDKMVAQANTEQPSSWTGI